MTGRIEVGHVQTLLAELASGCLHFLKNCRQHALYLPSYSVSVAAKKPGAMTMYTLDIVYVLVCVAIMHPDLHTTLQYLYLPILILHTTIDILPFYVSLATWGVGGVPPTSGC